MAEQTTFITIYLEKQMHLIIIHTNNKGKVKKFLVSSARHRVQIKKNAAGHKNKLREMRQVILCRIKGLVIGDH